MVPSDEYLKICASLQPRQPLPPMSGMAVLPDFAATLVSLILEARPSTILELGSGTSTIIAAYCVEKNGRGHVYSLDHDQRFGARTQAWLTAHELAEWATVRHAPLGRIALKDVAYQWYRHAILQEIPSIDLLLVDGPPGYQGGRTRFPALPVLFSRLAPDAVVLLDDAARADEQSIIAEWLRDFPCFEQTILPHVKGTVILKRR